ncbi:MAG: hypothetical protein QMD97_04605 [Candidatus Aenigmarchaeota archaeon]|nr:hypothetical protein [Candidatus Aenigmarchaeota archaeon]
MELVVKITQKGNIFKGKGRQIIIDNLTDAMYEATMMLEREVKMRTPKGVFGAQGGLYSSIKGEVEGKGMPVVKGIVAHGSKYGDLIEKGRTAGRKWPPEGDLIRWIEVKTGVDERTARKMEFLIRRKIGRKGFPGAHMFENALKENWPRLQRIFDRCGFEIAKEMNEGQ